MPAINTNVAALFAQQSLKVSERNQSSAMRQLSTGSRVNTAADDAAGMAIGQTMTSQVQGLNQAVRNLNDGINMMQTAEGALGETSNMLQRMRELAVQSMNGTYSGAQRGYMDTEFKALSAQIGRISSDTKWNDTALLGGTGSAGFTYQAGMSNGQTVVVSIIAMTVTGLGFFSGDSMLSAFAQPAVAQNAADENGTILTVARAQTFSGVATIMNVSLAKTSLGLIDTAIEKINTQRAKIGASINQMTYAVDNLSNVAANTAASRSTIMDTDYATASTQLSKTQIIQQAATAMLAQANQQPQSVLSLLK